MTFVRPLTWEEGSALFKSLTRNTLAASLAFTYESAI